MMMEDRSNYVLVTNRTGLPKPVLGRFDGKDYTFPEGKGVMVPLLVAQHIFDFGRKDKTTALSRLGWAHTSADIEAGLEMLEKISFEEPPEMIEAPTRGKGGRPKKVPADKTGTAGPPVTAGGTEGGGSPSPDGPGDDDDDDDDENAGEGKDTF